MLSSSTYLVLLVRRPVPVWVSAADEVERLGRWLWRFGRDAAHQKACHYGAVPTVQVITAGTDWPAIVAAVVTGVAAVAGIVGTGQQAARARKSASEDAANARKSASEDLDKSIKAAAQNLQDSNAADSRRAIRAEKIRIYSAFQGAVDAVIAVASQSNQQDGELSQAHSAMVKALAEVMLVAPKQICDLADQIKRSVTRSGVDPSGTIHRQYDQLYELMRADLAATDHTQPAPADPPRSLPFRRAGQSGGG